MTSPLVAGVYFDGAAAVEQFLRAYHPERVVGVAQVKVFCLD
jgi:hypothetical protein